MNIDRLMWLASGSSRVRPVTSEALPTIYSPQNSQPRKGSLDLAVSFYVGAAIYPGAKPLDFKLWKNGVEVYDGTTPTIIEIADGDELRAVVYPLEELIPTVWKSTFAGFMTVTGDNPALFPADCDVVFDDYTTILTMPNKVFDGDPVTETGGIATYQVFVDSRDPLEFGESVQDTLIFSVTSAVDSDDVTEVIVTFTAEMGKKQFIFEGMNEPVVYSTYAARETSIEDSFYFLDTWQKSIGVSIGLSSTITVGEYPTYFPEQNQYTNPNNSVLTLPIAGLVTQGLVGTYLDPMSLWKALNATWPEETLMANLVTVIGQPENTNWIANTVSPEPSATAPENKPIWIAPISTTQETSRRRVTIAFCAPINDAATINKTYRRESDVPAYNGLTSGQFWTQFDPAVNLDDLWWNKTRVVELLTDSENPPPTQTPIPVMITFEGKVYLTPDQWDDLAASVGQGVDSPDELDAYLETHPELWDAPGNTSLKLNLSDPVFGGLFDSTDPTQFSILPSSLTGEVQLNTQLTLGEAVKLGVDVYGGLRGLATLLKLGGNLAALSSPLGVVALIMAGLKVYKAYESVEAAMNRDSQVYSIPRDMSLFIQRHPEFAPRVRPVPQSLLPPPTSIP